MQYAFQNNFMGLILAALLGGLIGWILRRALSSSKPPDFESAWQTKLSDAEESWRARLSAIASERDQATEALREQESKLEVLRSKFVNLEGDHETLKTSFDEVSARIPALEAAASNVAKLTAEVNASSDVRALLESRTAEWAKSAQELEAERARVVAAGQSAAEEAATARAELEARLNALTDDCTRNDVFEKRIAGLTAELQTARANTTASERARKDTDGFWRARIATLESEKDQLQTRFADFAAKTDSAESGYKTRIAELAGQLERAKAELANVNKAQASHATSTAPRAAGPEDADRNRIADLEGQINRLRADAARASSAMSDAEGSWKTKYATLEADRNLFQSRYTELAAKMRDAEVHAQAATQNPKAMAATAGGASTFVDSRYGWGDIERIEGVGTIYGQKLRAIGIAWVKELLEQGCSAAGRARIVDDTGLDPVVILKWVNAADLLRVEGVTPNFAELLDASGVDTVNELLERVPENLHRKLLEVNATSPKRISKTDPAIEEVRSWVTRAGSLTPMVTH